ncbi:MAG: 30S ribosomal protein S17 [bacterium]|nr:30S ribosomal protein S17 [bacterium]
MARKLVGTVVSDKAEKTIVVSVRTRKTHPIYKKQFTSSKKFMAHDEKQEARTGDRVSIAETKPLSARKRFTLEKIIEKAKISETERVEAVAEKDIAVEEEKETK